MITLVIISTETTDIKYLHCVIQAKLSKNYHASVL